MENSTRLAVYESALENLAKKNSDGRKNLLDTIFRLMIGTVSMAALQAARTNDEDWYQEVPTWQKDTSWILGEGFKIPKSYDLLSRLTATISEDIFSNAPVDNRRYLQTLFDSVPSVFPTIFQTAAEAYADYSVFYGGSIVPQSQKNLPAYQQYGDKTSEFAKIIGKSDAAKVLSKIFFDRDDGFSPRKIDYMISGYAGFPGRLATSGIDLPVKQARGEEYSFEASEFPILKRFILDPYKNPQSISDYYKKRDEFNKKYTQAGVKPSGDDAKLFAKIKAADKQMQKISKQERKLKDDAKIPASELKAKLRELEKKRLEIAKKALKRD